MIAATRSRAPCVTMVARASRRSVAVREETSSSREETFAAAIATLLDAGTSDGEILLNARDSPSEGVDVDELERVRTHTADDARHVKPTTLTSCASSRRFSRASTRSGDRCARHLGKPRTSQKCLKPPEYLPKMSRGGWPTIGHSADTPMRIRKLLIRDSSTPTFYAKANHVLRMG